MNVLVIGGLGFVGSAIARSYIQCGHSVEIISRTKRKVDNIYPYKPTDIRRMDISHRTMPVGKKYDLIVHAASTTHNYHIYDNPRIDVETNCVGTINVLESVLQKSPKATVIYLSTFFVAGDSVGASGRHQEDQACNPLALYGATKLCAEHICKTYCRVHGLDVRIARLCNVYGPRDETDNLRKSAMARMLYQISQGQTVDLYKNAPMRDYIFIDDVVRAVDAIGHSGETGETYYVGTGIGVSVRHMLDVAIEYAGRGSYRYVSPPPFHRQAGIENFIADTSRLRSLAWAPLKTIPDGIAETMASFEHGE